MCNTGIIVEYNPLHNGHIHHLNSTRKMINSKHIIAIMSGNFVQRGEPAFINKWARTKSALKAGVDLVIELPVIYSNSSAEGFAFGAVSTLNSLGIVDNICFGSELGDTDKLSIIADILTNEPSEYKELLQSYLKTGLSYAAARQEALIAYIDIRGILYMSRPELENIIFNSNNILAIEYIKSLNKLSSKIKPYTIKRVNNAYNDENLTGFISSATSIRKNFNNFESITQSLPDFSFEAIMQEYKNGRCPITLENFSDIILYKLRNSHISYIRDLIDVNEGLENRIKKAAENSRDIRELIRTIKNKRYTATRIQRILINSLLEITKDIQHKIQTPSEYIRILGFNDRGKNLLKEMKEKCSLPIITNPSNKDSELLKYDIFATDVYVLGYKNTEFKIAKQDLKIPPVII